MRKRQRCPYCSNYSVQVTETRYSTDKRIVRRKKCLDCPARWYTIQSPEEFVTEDKVRYINRYRGTDPFLKEIYEKRENGNTDRIMISD
jgi:transcriptional regulator NrdR family protein